MADQDEGNEIKVPVPESTEDRVVEICSDSEDGEEILRQIVMEINLRIYPTRQVATTTQAVASNIGKKDDKGDEKKSNSLPNENESAAPAIVGVGRGRGRGRARNPPSSPPETVTLQKNESAAPPVVGVGRGRGRGRARNSPSSTPEPPTSISGPYAAPGPATSTIEPKGYEIEEPVVARFGRSELLETFTQHDRSFDGPMKVTASYVPIKEANAILRKAREEEKKNPPWFLIPVADENKPESEIEDADEEDIPNPYQ